MGYMYAECEINPDLVYICGEDLFLSGWSSFEEGYW
jgi:hypothetical protein